MCTWTELQPRLAAAFLDTGQLLPEEISARSTAAARRGREIHAANIGVALVDALQSGFPVTARLVGKEFFRAMARAYTRTVLPASPVMHEYGDGFPSFIGRFGPAHDVPYLADVARLEFAWTCAFHAADADPLGIETLQHIPIDQLPDARISLHPSCHAVRSPYPVATIWQMHANEGAITAPEVWRAEDVLVVRPHAEVIVRQLPSGGGAFVEALARGESIAASSIRAATPQNVPDAGQLLVDLVRTGAIIAALPAHPELEDHRR